jgi:methionyl-tRNA formyltransferase
VIKRLQPCFLGEVDMRILLFANNWVGWQVARWLKERGDNLVGLVVHPPHMRKYGEEILKTVGLPEDRIFDGSELRQADTMQSIKNLHADIGLSIFFGYILLPDFFHLFPAGVVNLHPSYLPYNRGTYPNVWSIIEGTPAGVSLHYIDVGIDTGDIIAQKQVPVEPVDTGETLYRMLERASVELMKDTWPIILSGQAGRRPQSVEEKSTFHRIRDVEKIDEIDLNRAYPARELINLLRARTFPPYTGAYFRVGNRKVYLRLQLLYEDDLRGELPENDH